MRTKPLERDIEKAIQEAFFYRHRITLWKIDAGCAGMRLGSSNGFRGHSTIPEGFPDLLGIIPPTGRLLAIEVKRPGKKPTTAQSAFIAQIVRDGGTAFWADSVESALEQFGHLVQS
jgi:hypothetical protein